MARVLLLLFLFTAFLAGCDNAESVRVEETRAKLVGTWLREVDGQGAKSRRVLTLDGDGRFTDRVLVSAPDGPSKQREFAGEWSYDGKNLKRRYLQENGRQFSGGGMRYATFPLVSVAQSELVVKDTIEGREVSYRRVLGDTQP